MKTLKDCKVGDNLVFTSNTGVQRDHYFVSYVSEKFLCVKSKDYYAEDGWEAIVDKETGTWTDGRDLKTFGKFSAKQPEPLYYVGDKFLTPYGTYMLTAPTADSRCLIHIETGRRAREAFAWKKDSGVPANVIHQQGIGHSNWQPV